MHGDEGGDGGWRLYFVRRLTDLLQQRHTAQRAASHVKRSLGLEFGEMEDVIDILFHRKVTAAQTFVLKLFVSFENQILFKQKNIDN